MSITEDYRLSFYQDYGPLGSKEHIRLVRDRRNGKMCVKKLLEQPPKEILTFRDQTTAPYFPKLREVIGKESQVIVIEEYIEGVTLEEYMMGEPIPEEQAVSFARQIGQALKCLHNFEPMIVYRDLKPENLMITTVGQVMLIDFDISRKFQEGKKRDTDLLGTAEYAAPEQFGYFQTDNRTDIYAFGILFNYMLTGKFPIEYVTEGRYAGMVRKCMELEPAKRYQCIEEILREFPKEGMMEQQISKQTYQEEATKRERRSWKLPGFRSKTPWKRVVAVLGYALIIYMGITTEFRNSDGSLYSTANLWISRSCMVLAEIATVLVATNYRGISEKILFYRHRFLGVRVLAWILTFLFFLLLAAITAAILGSIVSL